MKPDTKKQVLHGLEFLDGVAKRLHTEMWEGKPESIGGQELEGQELELWVMTEKLSREIGLLRQLLAEA